MSESADEQYFPGAERKQLTAREYACVLLRVPESGTPWLDELIRESIVEDVNRTRYVQVR